VLLEAELLELKANPHRKAMGTVAEASLDKGRGIVANLLVQTGSFALENPILAGPYSGKVKALFI
jgi:translation initiation factor IF-2